MTQPAVLTKDQFNDIEVANAKRFVSAVPDYYACGYNWDLMKAQMDSQTGTEYPHTFEQFIAAYEYLDSIEMLAIRPPSEEDQRRVQQQELAQDQESRQRKQELRERTKAVAQHLEEEKRTLRTMPLSALKVAANVERSQLRTDTPSSKQGWARSIVASKYPQLRIDSSEFNRHVAKEIQNLQSGDFNE